MLNTNVDSETQEMIIVEKEEKKPTVPKTSLALNAINNWP